MSVNLCYVKEQYFLEHKSFQKILDPGNTKKQSSRAYLCINLTFDGNNYYLPLRNNLGNEVRKFGRIGHSVPALNRQDAGIDYRYALLINDSTYIEIPNSQTIPNSQKNKIIKDYNIIEKEFEQYLRGFIKTARKNRIHMHPLYRESSLINFLDKLV